MRSQTRWGLIIGAGVLVGLVLVTCLALVFGLAGLAIPGRGFPGQYRSNGEQIYFTATSQRGTPITSDMGMGMMGGGAACASCHGPDGRGGRVRMMMGTFVAPDIRYGTLTAEEMEHEGEEAHPPYTDETIKRAITQGVDPAGEPLEWPMPRWTMTEEDLDNLLEFLKSLD
ncbi:MAG: c-type cytochrome [Anaerolineae bacterium]